MTRAFVFTEPGILAILETHPNDCCSTLGYFAATEAIEGAFGKSSQPSKFEENTAQRVVKAGDT